MYRRYRNTRELGDEQSKAHRNREALTRRRQDRGDRQTRTARARTIHGTRDRRVTNVVRGRTIRTAADVLHKESANGNESGSVAVRRHGPVTRIAAKPS